MDKSPKILLVGCPPEESVVAKFNGMDGLHHTNGIPTLAGTYYKISDEKVYTTWEVRTIVRKFCDFIGALCSIDAWCEQNIK